MKLEFNRHTKDVELGKFTMEWNVKNPKYPVNFATWFDGDMYYLQEFESKFILKYGDAAFKEIKRKYVNFTFEDWTLLGRSGGWFAIIGKGYWRMMVQSTEDRITSIVKRYYDNYDINLKLYYENGPEFKTFKFER